MGKTAVYARVSSDSPDQQHALEQQLDRLRTAAPDAQEYIEIESGTRTDRPIWDQLMVDCKDGKVDRVIATRLDRISRSRVHGAQILQYFMQPTSPVSGAVRRQHRPWNQRWQVHGVIVDQLGRGGIRTLRRAHTARSRLQAITTQAVWAAARLLATGTTPIEVITSSILQRRTSPLI